MMRILHLHLLGFRTSILDLLAGSYFGNWMNSREKGSLSLADKAGPISLTPAILASSNVRNSAVAGVGGPGVSPAKAA